MLRLLLAKEWSITVKVNMLWIRRHFKMSISVYVGVN